MISLREHQVPHYQSLLQVLASNRAALDASDTGTGKTVVALFICKAMGVVPFVVAPKNARVGWEDLSKALGVSIEFINYEKLRGRRKFRESIGRAVTETDYIQEVPWGKGSFIKWKNNYRLIIFDEVHRCTGKTTLNSKLLIAAKRQAEYVLALSATAADNPLQMKALGYALGLHGNSKKTRVLPDYMGWLYRHGVKPGVFGGFEFTSDPEKQKQAMTKLHGEIFPRKGARMRKAEIPGFPKTLIDVMYFEDEGQKAKKLVEQIHEENSDSLAASMKSRRELEFLKIPFLVDATSDAAQSSKVVVFLNFTDPLFEMLEQLRNQFGNDKVGYISGTQTGEQGYAERRDFLERFQKNKLDALVVNSAAGSESASMHDPIDKVDRTTLISPVESSRTLDQVIGRVNRDGGGFSRQFIACFKGTLEEIVYERVKQNSFNLKLFNDADLML